MIGVATDVDGCDDDKVMLALFVSAGEDVASSSW